MHVATCRPTFPRKLSVSGKSRHLCDDPVCPDPVWKLSNSLALGDSRVSPQVGRQGNNSDPCIQHPASEKGEVLLRGVGTLRYLLILSENSACQVPICAVAAWWSDNTHQQVVPRSQIPRTTSHFSYSLGARFSHSERGRWAWRPLPHLKLASTWHTSYIYVCVYDDIFV